ncbi:hypothetical protein NQ318_011010 [Aromia moschata]|uniref:Transposase n=1 Tax=Aromia moschata TaxID=1265417 RepID=A0AAV8YN48_9CUCU|nr:hypothetical protein NQ318_011010 [Aromia moschata]
MPLNERDRIEILMMIGVGDRMRTQQEVCRLFHEMHPDREPVSQSTVSRIERKYRELGHVRDAPRQGRPKINENVQQDVILSALENPHCTVRQVSRDLNIGKSSVSNIFKKVKYHPYRVRLIHELAEDDFDRRTEFCEYMMDHNNQNNGFIANILFSDEATLWKLAVGPANFKSLQVMPLGEFETNRHTTQVPTGAEKTGVAYN